MKTSDTNKKDKLIAGPVTTDSLGLSTSANITIESAGKSGDGSTSLFPDFKEEKSWSSKTTATVDENNR